jgi:hypothetical protein
LRFRSEALALVLLAGAAAAGPSLRVADFLLLLTPEGIGRARVDALLDGVELDWRGVEMTTPLHRAAAESSDPDLIRAMAARGANPAARTASGRTPLHMAAARNPSAAVAGALVAAGAPVDARDAEGLTPLHAAAGNPAVAALLVLAGADACATDAAGNPALDAATVEAVRRTLPEVYPAVRAAFLDCL